VLAHDPTPKLVRHFAPRSTNTDCDDLSHLPPSPFV